MDIFDLLLAPFYLLLVLFIAYKYKAKHEHEHPAFKYFLPGLITKIIGAIALGMVYFYYYGGGDTVNYHQTACGFVNVFTKDFDNFIYLYFGKPVMSEFYLFNSEEGFVYWVKDQYAFFVSKIFFLFILISFKSYIAGAILVASVCYIAVWQLYMVFINEFSEIYKELAYGILFIPSVVFWGSGLMKDSVTFSAACLYVYGFYWFAIKKIRTLYYAGAIFSAAFLLLSIKPYILFALLPGSGVWLISLRISKVKNFLVKILIGPVVIIGISILVFFIMSNLGDKLGKYSIDKVFGTAQSSQQDLKQDYYRGNTFDIGDYDASLTGLLSVSHKAIFATLYRPTLLDVRNVIMLFSALENTFLLLFTFYLLVKLRFFKFFLYLGSHPLALFSFIFSIFFAISVGVSISNFGTLVRLKIPCVPFFICSLLIVNYIMKKKEIS